MDEQQALTDLALQTGPLGAMIVILGSLIRRWFQKTEERLDALVKRDDAVDERARALDLEQRDQGRRIEALERKAGVR